MYYRHLATVVGALLLFHPYAPWAGDGSDDSELRPIDIEEATISRFLKNKGQLDDGSVRYYAHLEAGGVAFLEDAVVISIFGWDDNINPAGPRCPLARGIQSLGFNDAPREQVSGCSVRLTFESTNQVEPVGTKALPGVFNFIQGSNAADWVQGVTAFSEVAYRSLYDGIDLVFSSEQGMLKYEFHVRPGADPEVISVLIEGHDHLAIEEGDLVVSTSAGDIVDGGLRVFHADAPEDELAATFHLFDGDRYGFSIPGRDPSRELIIDPVIYSAYLGRTEDEDVCGCEIDNEGCVFVAGCTESSNFPCTPGAWDTTLDGWYDIFVTKMGADGSSLEFSTFLGGDSLEYPTCLVVDGSGDVYIAGDTSSRDFPTTAGCLQEKPQGGTDGFVTKLNRTGTTLEYSTYLGSPLEDFLSGITIDALGNAYIVGNTNSFNFTVTADAYQKYKTMENDSYEGVVFKIDPSGSRLLYSTYIGGLGYDSPHTIQVNDEGEFYVAGQTYASNFPTTNGAYMEDMVGQDQIGFITKFKSDGSDLLFSTYIGGSGEDEIQSLAVDTNGNATLVGRTGSRDYPVTPGAIQRVYGGSIFDGFLSMLSADGSSLVSSTFLGGRNIDEITDIAIDDKGRFHIGGDTSSSNYQVTSDAHQSRLEGVLDGTVSIISADMSDLEYSTYLGGDDVDYVMGVGLLSSLILVVAGITFSYDFPTTQGAYQVRHGGGSDAFITKWNFDKIPPRADAGPDVVIDQHETVWFNGSDSWDNLGLANWSWAFRYRTDDITLFGSEVSFTFDDAGIYTVTLTVQDISLLNGTDTMNVTVRDITPPIANAGPDQSIIQYETMVFDGLDSTDNVGIVNWTWTFVHEGEMTVLSGPGSEFTFCEAGDFNVTLEVSDAAGLNDTDWMMVHVMDILFPVAEAGASIHISQRDTATLDGSGSRDNVGIVNWTWTFTYQEVSVTLQGEVVKFAFDDSGDYTITLRVQDAAGNHALDTVIVHVLDITPPLADAGEDVEIDQGTTVYFDARGSMDNERISSYSWSFDYNGVPIHLNGATPKYWFGTAGEYEVKLTVTDEAGNEATDTVQVTVLDITNPIASAGPDIFIDQHGSAPFDGSTSHDDVGIEQWKWEFYYEGRTVELDGATSSYTFDEAGRYNVTLTVTDTAGNTGSDMVVVLVRDIKTPIADPGLDRTVNQFTTVHLDSGKSTDNVGIELWDWYFEQRGGPVHLHGEKVSFTFEDPGVYPVKLNVTDAAGNSDETSFILTVRDVIDPIAASQGDIEVKRGRKVTLDGTASTDNVEVVNWTWTITFEGTDRTEKLYGPLVNYAFEDAGRHFVLLTVKDADGNVGTAGFSVTVKTNPFPLLLVVILVIITVVVLGYILRHRGD